MAISALNNKKVEVSVHLWAIVGNVYIMVMLSKTIYGFHIYHDQESLVVQGVGFQLVKDFPRVTEMSFFEFEKVSTTSYTIYCSKGQ